MANPHDNCLKGLGVMLSRVGGRVMLAGTSAGSPAALCGDLQIWDELVGINGRALKVPHREFQRPLGRHKSAVREH